MLNQKRVVIDHISPQINGGEFFIKRVVNEIVSVDANLLVDGQNSIAAAVVFKHEKAKLWSETSMFLVENDEWKSSFKVSKQGFYDYKIQAWIDAGLNWQSNIAYRIEDKQHVNFQLLEGVDHLSLLLKKVTNTEKLYLENCIRLFANTASYNDAVIEARSKKLYQIFVKYPQKKFCSESKEFQVYVDRKKARFSTWYEVFPRSTSETEGKHGTFKDCERLLPKIAQMGFDTLCFPPIHPIGEFNRKGKNNSTDAQKDDVGSVWAIGSKHGGQKDLDPELGTIADFKRLIKKAKEHDIEIAMDYALHATPDHPWVKSNPDWFKQRTDGTIDFENHEKNQHGILPMNWETKDYKNLWNECLDTMLFWVDCGIHIFRVDNPQNKPYYFWNWLISEVKQKHPNVIFLAEAFTRPKVMNQLAKQGFSQSYTYFTWRNTKQEFMEYMTELTQTSQSEYIQPSFWPNSPDINPYHLQGAIESKYIQRYALAATLSSSIGIYGPVFEQMLDQAIPGKEEYYMSEKFQISHYDWFIENKLTLLISKINAIRQDNEALQQTNNIQFCAIENENIIAFYKWNDDRTNEMLMVISIDHHNSQHGNVELPIDDLDLQPGYGVEVSDLVTGSSYKWYQEWNYVELHPTLPFHIFKINKRQLKETSTIINN